MYKGRMCAVLHTFCAYIHNVHCVLISADYVILQILSNKKV